MLAQVPSRPHVVVSRMADGNPATRLIVADPTSGQLTNLPRFAGDDLCPLAIALDPFDGQAVVALDTATGSSRLVRVAIEGGAPAAITLGEVSGKVCDLLIADDWLYLAADDAQAGVLRLPRRGGAVETVFAHANVTALSVSHMQTGAIVAGWSGRPSTASTEPGLAVIDVATGALLHSQTSISAPNSTELTGIADLPTSTPYQLTAFADGAFVLVGTAGSTVATFSNGSPGFATTSTAALHTLENSAAGALVLGSNPMPTLCELDVFGGTTHVLSGPLPGTPVDVAQGLDLLGRTRFFGESCGAASPLSHSVLGTHQPGSQLTFRLDGATPSNPAILLLGLDDDAALLPVPLFGSCLLHVLPSSAVFATADPLGSAQSRLTVPLQAWLLGCRLFAQWVEPRAASYAVTGGAAVQIGF
jgi:hypothetical protein